MGKIGSPAEIAVKDILQYLSADDPDGVYEILSTIEGIGPNASEAVWPLIEFTIEHPDFFQEIDIGLTAAFTSIGEDAVIPLLTLLQHEDEKIRKIARGPLGNLQEVAGIATLQLAELLSDKRNDVRYIAAQLLWMIGPEAKAALPALKAAVNDVSPEVREMVQKAIEAVSE